MKLRFFIFQILMLVLAGVSVSAEPGSKEPDSARASDSKTLAQIEKLTYSDFTIPVQTVLKPIPAKVCAHDCKAAYVWLKVRIGKAHQVTESEVVFCSSPGDGFEALAQEVIQTQSVFCPDGADSSQRWLWHQVIFTGDESIPRCDSSGYPRPDDFVSVEMAPEMTYQSAPSYPKIAKTAGVTGTVWVKSLVDREGQVRMVMVNHSSGSPALDNAAVISAWKCQFDPAMQDGRPVAVWVTYKIAFELGTPPISVQTNKIPERLRNSPKSSFLDPNTTAYKLDTTQMSLFHGVDQWVLLQVELDKQNGVRKAKVVYCSSPDCGLEKLAIDTVRTQHFETATKHGTMDLFWHRVVFTEADSIESWDLYSPPRSYRLVRDSMTGWDSSSAPQPDEYVPLDVAPEMTFQPKLEFPKLAIGQRLFGIVWVKALVDRNGVVRKAMVSQSSGSTALDEAAIANAYGCQFRPAMQNNRTVAVWVSYDVVFKR
jgi:TonB family protein